MIAPTAARTGTKAAATTPTVKCKDTQDYESYLQSVTPLAGAISYVHMHNRRLATVTLRESIDFGSLGQTIFLEVMEPRPEKVGTDLVGFEHIEIFNRDLEGIAHLLAVKRVPYENYENPNHKAVVVQINDSGQELKFTDSRLGEIIAKQLVTGESITIL